MTYIFYEDKEIDENKHLSETIKFHFKHTPFWIRFQDKNKIDISKIREIKDLNIFPFFNDDDIRNINPENLIPIPFIKEREKLIKSTSSGTTGHPKVSYWHNDTVESMINFAEKVLRLHSFPENENWVCTGPDNDLFKEFIRRVSERMKGKFVYIQIDAKKAKKINDPRHDFFTSFVDEIKNHFKTKKIGVYEDIAPIIRRTGLELELEKRENVKGVMFGGVGMNFEDYKHFKDVLFKNAVICGWYGDFMNGTSMFIPSESSNSLVYRPLYPYVILDVRDKNNFSKNIKYGERGVVISHRISKELFLPNRITGDAATRIKPIEPFYWDGVADIGRMELKINK